jgi:hypothetical protein
MDNTTPTKTRTFCSGIPRMKMAVESCCQAHDRQYGSKATMTRAEADRALYECLKASGRPLFARIAWIAVRAFGWMAYQR